MRPERARASSRRRGGVLKALAGSPRRRRLLFVLALAPGMVIAMILAPALRSPGLMLLGLVLLAAVVLARALSEPAFAPDVPGEPVQDLAPQDPPRSEIA
jgi:hypothetical protein